MIFRRIFLFSLVMGAFIPLTLSAETGASVTFVVNTILSPDQIDEVETLTINQQTVGTLKVGGGKLADSLTVTVPAALTYRYTLCGHSHLRGPGGSVVTDKIQSVGRFPDANGRTLGVFGDDGSPEFYLQDMTTGKPQVLVQILKASQNCPEDVAME